MAIQFSVAARNASLDSFETTTGTSAILRLRTGAPPATCATADSGTSLVALSLPSDWMAAASAGSKALLGTWQGSGIAAGTAAHFRVYDSGGTVCHAQGTVTATGFGGDMTVDNTNIAVSQVVTVTTFTLTAGNA